MVDFTDHYSVNADNMKSCGLWDVPFNTFSEFRFFWFQVKRSNCVRPQRDLSVWQQAGTPTIAGDRLMTRTESSTVPNFTGSTFNVPRASSASHSPLSEIVSDNGRNQPFTHRCGYPGNHTVNQDIPCYTTVFVYV